MIHEPEDDDNMFSLLIMQNPAPPEQVPNIGDGRKGKRARTPGRRKAPDANCSE